MHTDDLIKSLTEQLQPTSPQALSRALLKAMALGSVGTLVIFVLGYGLRDDLASIWNSWPMLMKLTYAISMVLCTWLLCERLARPGIEPGRQLLLPLLPMVLLGGIALNTALQVPDEARRIIWLGHSWWQCPLNIGLLSLPIFAALCRRLREAAPTQLRTCAAVAGLLSGALATVFYSLFCTESSVQFVASWYTLGMLLPAGYGAIFGPQLLRWR